MKTTNNRAILLLVCFTFLSLLLLLFGCTSLFDSNSNEETMRRYYEVEDFQLIVIGTSSFQDVYDIAPTESMQITSYGGFCEYPMCNGRRIRIEFYGKDLIVGAIKEVQ